MADHVEAIFTSGKFDCINNCFYRNLLYTILHIWLYVSFELYIAIYTVAI